MSYLNKDLNNKVNIHLHSFIWDINGIHRISRTGNISERKLSFKCLIFTFLLKYWFPLDFWSHLIFQIFEKYCVLILSSILYSPFKNFNFLEYFLSSSLQMKLLYVDMLNVFAAIFHCWKHRLFPNFHCYKDLLIIVLLIWKGKREKQKWRDRQRSAFTTSPSKSLKQLVLGQAKDRSEELHPRPPLEP